MNEAKRLIVERQKFVEKVIRFVHELLNAEGKVLKRETHSCHMYSLRELQLEGFKFMDEGSLTMYGGDVVTISFNGWLVFEVKYHDIEEAEVLQFDLTMPCPDWQTPLKRLMRLGIPRISAKLEAAKKKFAARADKDFKAVTAHQELRKEMERLRLVS